MKNWQPVETFCKNTTKYSETLPSLLDFLLQKSVLSWSRNDPLNLFSTKESFLSDNDELFPNSYKRPPWGGDYQSGPLSELEISDEKNELL